MSNQTEIAGRFAADTDHHEMTVLRDDGLYRHVRFQRVTVNKETGKRERSSFYWFDLITWPGCLAIRGDMDSYLFARNEDMFEFFRMHHTRDGINPGYWAEKTQGPVRTKEYSEALFRQLVIEHFTESVRYGGVPKGLGKAIREQLLDNEETYFEQGAHSALSNFEYEGYRFSDTWEWDLTDWSWQYLWCCHAIRWGIAQYDAEVKRAAASKAEVTA